MSKKAAKVETPETPETPEVKPEGGEIAENDLLKGLTTLEAEVKGEEKTEEPAPKPTVEKVDAPTLAKTVEEKGSEVLAKSLEVSATLREVTDLLGEHVDSLSSSFAKTLDNQNAAILSISEILTGLAKSVDGLRETVEKYGEKPAAPASAKAPAKAEPGDVLAKGAGTGSGDPEQGADVTRNQISDALMSLVKNASDDAEEADRWTSVLVKYEATGQISDRNLHGAIKEHKRITE